MGLIRDERAEQLRVQLGLAAHPEGGYYREFHRKQSTAIYYLLCRAGDVVCEEAHSAWHRIPQDEIWHHYEGAVVDLHVMDGRTYRVERLGPVSADSQPVRVVPGGAWQAARVRGYPGYALCGNTVAPAFEFASFEVADDRTVRELAARHPDAAELILSLAAAQALDAKT